MSRTHADPDFEPRIADWLEDDPDHAPGMVLVTVLAAFPSIPQRRASRVPRRFQNMNRFVLLAAAATLVVAAGLGGALLAARSNDQGTGTPRLTSAPTPTWPYIPDGLYLGPEQPAADILAALAADTTLTESQRTTIIDTILGIRSASTYQTQIRLLGDMMVVTNSVDGASAPEDWAIEPAGDGLLRAGGPAACGSSTTARCTVVFRVGGCDGTTDPCSFTLEATTPASSAIETFVRRIVFETGAFEPQPDALTTGPPGSASR